MVQIAAENYNNIDDKDNTDSDDYINHTDTFSVMFECSEDVQAKTAKSDLASVTQILNVLFIGQLILRHCTKNVFVYYISQQSRSAYGAVWKFLVRKASGRPIYSKTRME